MVADLIVHIVSFFLSGGITFLNIFYVLSLQDLESDMLSPSDLSSRINFGRKVEYGLHAGLTALQLLAGNYVLFLLNLPVAIYNAREYQRRTYTIDPYAVFSRLDKMKKTSYLWSSIHAALTICYIISLVYTLLAGVGISKSATSAVQDNVFGRMSDRIRLPVD